MALRNLVYRDCLFPRQAYRRAFDALLEAKGRVERTNRTLQDRLVKEMRLRGIGGMEAGNAYLGEFMADFNRHFRKCLDQSSTTNPGRPKGDISTLR